jgi:molybdate transport system permease protein
MSFDWRVVFVTTKLAGVSTLVLLIGGTPLAWWLTRTRSKLRPIVEAVVALPLVLPPTVLGFYILIMLGPAGPIGNFWESLGGPRLVFSFPGLVVGSVLYSLPFVVQPLQNAFGAIPARLLDAAAMLRANALDRFVTIVLPLARPGFLTAATLGFAHTVGEFGVVLMIGGNIPGRTEVLSIALYNHVEALEYTEAHVLAAVLLVFSFSVLFAVYALSRRFETPRL